MQDMNTENQFQAPNSTMAVVSFISGILGLTLIPIVGSIAALIVGYMARKEIRESNGAMGGDNFATLGLVLGWIGVGLTVLVCCFLSLIVLIVPVGILIDEVSMQFNHYFFLF